jgi:hypothetical protein
MRVPSIRFAHVRRGKAEAPPGLVGVARVDSRTKVLVRRLEPGDIAIIDHPDLDRVSADELIACRVAAVVNAARSVTGRYPKTTSARKYCRGSSRAAPSGSTRASSTAAATRSSPRACR